MNGPLSLPFTSLLFVLLLAIPLAAEAASDDRVEFDVKPQSLDSALRRFSDQSHLQVFYASELVADYDSPGVNGSFTAEEAMALVLSSSPLGFRYNSKDTIVVTESREEARAPNQPKAKAQPSHTP